MFQRYALAALAAIALAVPANAQPRLPAPTQSNTNFLALFKPALETAAKSVVRVQVDGKDAALGTVVSDDGYMLTKASELKLGKVTVKTKDGRELEATVTTTSDAYDLAVLKAEGTGLTPISWGDTKDAPVGNWIAVTGLGGDAVAAGVVSTRPWSPRETRLPTAETGFLGVQIDQGANGAVVDKVTSGSAADKAGLRSADVIRKVDDHNIDDGETLIQTLLDYKAGQSVKLLVERDGKRLELTVILGKRPSELVPPPGSGRGGSPRGDFQNAMGSKLSDRRTGIPVLFQTDAVVKPADCGAPVVDLDGHAVGLIIARAGRTESHVVPAETVRDLIPVLMATRPRANPVDRVDQARAALKKAEGAKVSSEVLAEAKRQLQSALGDEKWWKEQKWWHGQPIEHGPAPHVLAPPAKK
jgi:serine protease Do